MKSIGPSFASELAAAGISLDGIAWMIDGTITFSPTVTDATRAAAALVYDAHNPLTSSVAMTRATLDEQERLACKTDGPLLGLINQTRAEWVAWAGQNFLSVTPAERQRLGIICWLVAISIRRLIRNGG